MKIKMTELGIEITPETDYEKSCLNHLVKQHNVKFRWSDEWNGNGNLIIEGEVDNWK